MKLSILHIMLFSGILLLSTTAVVLIYRLGEIDIQSQTLKSRPPRKSQQVARSKVLVNAVTTSDKNAQNKKVHSRIHTSSTRHQNSSKQTIDRTKKGADEPSMNYGVVSYLKGTATSIDEAGETSILSLDTKIHARQIITTSPKSKLEISMPDGTVLSLGSNTSIAIDKYVFSIEQKEKNAISLRIIKGISRVVTGLITKMNPDKFKARTDMASIGIRGCDLAIRSAKNTDTIYVLGLAGKESVEIAAGKKGQTLTNTTTGKHIEVDPEQLTGISVTEDQTMITIGKGNGILINRKMNLEETRNVISETSQFTNARYRIGQKGGTTIFTVTPDQKGKNQK